MSEDLVTEVSDVVDESIADPGQATDPVSALTADLQRLQAEYANYKKRVERDRSLAHELAVSSVLIEMLPILDDIERAQIHGELTGRFKAVADQIASVTERIGLVSMELLAMNLIHKFTKHFSMTHRQMSQHRLQQKSCNQDINSKSAFFVLLALQ